MSEKKEVHGALYVSFGILFLVNAFLPGCVEAARWAKTVSDSSFAGMFVMFGWITYGLPAIAASVLGLVACKLLISKYRFLSSLAFAFTIAIVCGIWYYAWTHPFKR